MRRAKLPKVLTAVTAVIAGTAAVMVPNAASAADADLTIKAADDTYTLERPQDRRLRLGRQTRGGQARCRRQDRVREVHRSLGHRGAQSRALFLRPPSTPAGKVTVSRVVARGAVLAQRPNLPRR